MHTAIEAYELVENAAKVARRDERRIRVMNVGEFIRQGDIYIAKIADGSVYGKKLDTLQEDAAFAAGVEQILIHHGIAVPGRVDKIIRALPMIGLFIR